MRNRRGLMQPGLVQANGPFLASDLVAGLMSAAEFTKLAGLPSVSTVTLNSASQVFSIPVTGKGLIRASGRLVNNAVGQSYPAGKINGSSTNVAFYGMGVGSGVVQSSSWLAVVRNVAPSEFTLTCYVGKDSGLPRVAVLAWGTGILAGADAFVSSIVFADTVTDITTIDIDSGVVNGWAAGGSAIVETF